LHPGDYLGAESDLIEHYGVSRGPVRDALRTLEAFGVVDIRVGAHGGIFVASSDPTRFSNTLAVQLKLMEVGRNDLIDSLSAIEQYAADLATRRATDEELVRLSDLVRELGKISDHDEFTSRSFEFHSAVASASHNPVLVVHIEMLRHVLHSTFSSQVSKETMKRILTKDRQLVKLLRNQDAEAVRKLIRRHWERVKAGKL
jgi:DNA-binding FadR family transcriptional regulator